MTSWWSDEKISTTVNREFIAREIGPKKYQDALHRPLAFGDGLTDDTYLDWILEKGCRCFLTLNSIGVPERIFDLIDKTLDDDDLPLTEEALYDLNLFGGKSETLDKKFHRQQFSFLVHDLVPGGHRDFGEDEVVPIEPVATKKAGVSNASSTNHRVCVRDRLYTRKRIATAGENGVDRVHFDMQIKALHALRHPHLITVFATYTQRDFSYMLLSPVTDITLRTFLEEQPKFFKCLEKHQRRETLLRWTLCLSSGLAYLHEHGFTHQNIRPSNVTVDSNNTIYLSNFAALNVFDSAEENSSPYRTEVYEHAAPEIWCRKLSVYEMAPDKTLHPGGGRTARRMPHPDKSSTARFSFISPSPIVTHRPRSHSVTTSSSNSSSTHSRPNKALITTFQPPLPSSSASAAADVFSLTTVLLHLLSLLLGHGPKSFASHRSRHNRQAGRGGAPADASFHSNLKEVGTWIEMLIKEAGEREQKDKKGKGTGGTFWRSVGGAVHSSEGGLRKEPYQRLDARELERKLGKYVGRALGDHGERQCGCGEQDEKSTKSRHASPKKGKARETGLNEEEDAEQSQLQSQYRLLKPEMIRDSAIDQERRMGMVLPVRDNWPLEHRAL
ncbi:MAG: hypothetical protein LQ342_001815 [Letrouitia transgressa]|nr:MAG: hypothetical protein LQ342_001815 [Letrouitia transgressa]